MLAELLAARKDAVIKRWGQLIAESYPPDTARFLQRESDRFRNPVGHAIAQETRTIYEELLKGGTSDRLCGSIDNLIKIRAVQELSPSQAVSFVPLLKRAVREALEGEARQPTAFAQWLELDARLDQVALLAFDSYMKHRERICELRISEVSKRTARIMERLNRIYGNQELEVDLASGFGSSDSRYGE